MQYKPNYSRWAIPVDKSIHDAMDEALAAHWVGMFIGWAATVTPAGLEALKRSGR